MRIRQLSPMLANQIAAGEVIERPASVVKELLENALDAGADDISIEIAHGGLNQIKISDNGCGIHAEDLMLAVAPHATSKIGELADLFKIESMGFRGEALASIASIARVNIYSRTREDKHAHRLTVDESGLTCSPIARNPGTTVEVGDLFYNAPVRKKFLKSAKLEFQAIETVVKRFALSAPHISLQLKHEGKSILSLPAAPNPEKEKQRLAKIFGQSFIREAHYLDVSYEGMRLTGWISGPHCQRSQNDRIWISVNQRMVKDKLLQHALKSAYESILYPGRFPACFLHFTLPPEAVDVNVHPTKHELRFQNPRLIHDFFTTHLLSALDIQPSAVQPPWPEKKSTSTWIPELQEKKPVYHHQSPWVILDNQYGLLFKGAVPWLVNMQALYQKVSSDRLKKEAQPLASRPLLVPFYYAFDPQKQSIAENIATILSKAGVHCILTEPGLFQIDSLPIALPQLDIRKLLDSLFMQDASQEPDVYTILAQSQWIDAQQIDDASRQDLAAMLEQMDTAEQAQFTRELHVERLHGIFV